MVSSDYYVDNSDIELSTLEAARNYYNDGKYSDALKLYLSLTNASISFRLYYDIGRCYYKLNDLLSAEDYFNKSINIESVNNPSFLYLGNVYYKKSDLHNAIEYWSKTFAYKPDDEAVCLNLATSYFSKDMRFQAVFYYDKYLKYASENSKSYDVIKVSIDKCKNIAFELLQKARQDVALNHYKTAIEDLSFAVKNMPISFDINHFLGKVYLEINDYMHALIYLKQALCLDSRSLDVLQKLASVYINLGDYTATYCIMRRLLPLILHNQTEYMKTIKLINDLKSSFDAYSYQGHLEWAKRYDEENNYHMAILEYENASMLSEEILEKYAERIEILKSYINPEERIVKICLEKGGDFYSDKDYKRSNRYFSRVMNMTDKNSSEYKLAKSRVVDV